MLKFKHNFQTLNNKHNIKTTPIYNIVLIFILKNSIYKSYFSQNCQHNATPFCKDNMKQVF